MNVLKEKGIFACMSNALTRLHYKKLFGVGLFQDISKMNTINKKQVILENQLKYIMISQGLKFLKKHQ